MRQRDVLLLTGLALVAGGLFFAYTDGSRWGTGFAGLGVFFVIAAIRPPSK